MAPTVLRFFFLHCRQNTYFIIGLCIGICASLLLTPMLENECIFIKYQDPGSKSVGNDPISNFFDNEYDPVINLAGKPQKALKTPQTLLRPRYYSTELGIRERLFIGILTSQKKNMVDSRAVSINKTISHIVDKVMYFLDAPGPQKLNTSMPGIVGFTDSRKILKPFHMLKYIIDNHLDDYNFFFFIKDSAYIKAQHLYNVVQDISVSQDVHAGSGRIDEHSAFCSLDAGLLLSNSVLRKVSENLDWCVKNAFSDLDDANVGRCIVHATNIACQESVQGQHLKSFTLPDSFKFEDDISTFSQEPAFQTAFTIYPVSDPVTMYKIHMYLSKVALVEVKRNISHLRRSITNTSMIAPVPVEPVAAKWPIGNQGGNIPTTRFDVLQWNYLSEKEFYLNSDFSNVKQMNGADKLDMAYILNATILKVESSDEQLKFRRLIDGYRRFDPSRGIDYILELAFKDLSTGHEVHKRLQVCRPLGKVEVVPMPYVTENNRINLVLPVNAKNREQTKHFIEQYTHICMETRDKTLLMLILLYDPTVPGKGNKDDIFLEIKQTALVLSDRYKKEGSKIAWVSVKLPDVSVDNSLLNFAITDLVLKKFPPDSLILMCQSNMEVRHEFLNRVRMNTILNWQVFSPIPFTEFHPDVVYTNTFVQPPTFLDINKNYGHYDSNQKDYIAFYAKDYSLARKTVENIIPIIRSDHDISMLTSKHTDSKSFQESCPLNSIYSMFVCYGKIHVLRAVEPGLRLRYQERDCPSTVDSSVYQKCIEERAFNLGFRNQLARLILEYKKTHLL
ncbi:hypothetical protein R5R35_012982 [Gryllus longicercus]|uniref:Hexosyltransferase n=1 Tax=Gryllus longicercus TaxID=2509291 RepID=A0AAN9YYM4_9ORTH